LFRSTRLLESGGGDERHRRAERQRLEALLAYCETPGCRRQALLAYFGEELQDPCGNCDTCLEPVETFDGTVAAQKLLSTAVRTGQRFGAGHLIDVLLGKETDRIRSLRHDGLSTFGIGTELDVAGWRSVVRQLLANGHLVPGAGAVLGGGVEGVMRRDRLRRRAARTGRGRGAAPTATVSAAAEDLFQELRALRAQIAKEQGVPPYVVFHDRTLREMVATM